MANSTPQDRATSGLDLHLDLTRGRGLRVGLEEGLRQAIRSGRLSRGTRLPATRTLARDLGVSRGTVLAAYAQLAAEGWVAGRRGSGTVVAADPTVADPQPADPVAQTWRYDLRPGLPDPSSFPRVAWLRALRRALATARDELFGYTDPRGLPQLRTELAGYLRRARGLHLTADHVIATTGFTQSLNLLMRTLDVGRVAMEEPSLPAHRAIVRAAGHEVILLPVDSDGAQLTNLDGAGAVVLTPNRQHPLGVTLSPARRSHLLDWARATGAFVVEDDYDGEFRYDSHPLGSLQGLDPSCVVYAGTAAKSLAPGLRLGWLAVPDALLHRVAELKRQTDGQTGVLEQLALTEFLRSGAYDKHVRRQRLRYRHRRDRLVAALPPDLRTSGASAGLNLLIHLPDETAEREALAAAKEHGVAVGGLTQDGYYESESTIAGLIVGYAASPEHGFQQAVEALVAVLRASSSR
jgi:GntR family transcriptional regulator/MocR family aminotransferase